MYFYEILQSIMDEKDLSIADVARLSNLPDSTVRSIINRKNKTVALEVAFKLSNGLNVSLEKLNGENESECKKVKTLTSMQHEIISDIEQMNDSDLLAVKTFISFLYENKKSLGNGTTFS